MSEKTFQILYVEDEEAHIKLVQRAFRNIAYGMELSVARTIKEANEFLRAKTPDVVLTDYLLPDGKGLELVPEQGQEKSKFPFVILTSQGNEQVAVDALKRGVLDYVVKSENTFAEMPRIAERTIREWRHIVEKENSLNLLKKVIESLTTQVIVLNQDGNVELLNGVFDNQSHGCLFKSSSQLVGLNYVNFLLDCQKETQNTSDLEFLRLIEEIRKTLDGRSQHFDGEYESLIDGKTRNYQIRLQTLSVGKDSRTILTIEEITERKIIENKKVEQAVAQAQLEMISPREKQVLHMIAEGDSNKTVAGKLDLSERTVEKHRASAMKKLDVKSLANVVRIVVSSEDAN